MAGNCKYYKQKKQVSYDNGVTWQDVSPAEYQKGDLYEADSNDCGYTPSGGYAAQYLTFRALDSGTFKFSGLTINYSLDNGATWEELRNNTNTPAIAAGNTILWKYESLDSSVIVERGRFSSSGRFIVYGNIMSMAFGDDFISATAVNGHSLSYLFSYCTGLTSAENLVLPATSIGARSYECMFYGCTNLTTAPAILPATQLSGYCYYGMFEGCTSLTTAPVLPATTLAEGCYYGMFVSCTSLTTAPELPATRLAPYCYQEMFYACYSLTTPPQLPATTLADCCYDGMFISCTSLTTAPVLHATTLVDYCYYQMFFNCTNLNSVTCLATDISAEDCTYWWLADVSATGTFTKAAGMNDWPSGADGIPDGWTVVE